MCSSLDERLSDVRLRIDQACRRAGRSPDDVTIVAVTKRHGPEVVRAAAESGLSVMGENKVQEATQKVGLCPSHLVWHLVGHLQSNKARQAAALFSMVHSVDSWSLLAKLDAACAETGKEMPVCLQVNVSGESSKSGLSPEEAPGVLEQCGSLMHVDVVGLMTMPPFSEDPEHARPFFRRLRTLRDEWRDRTGIPLEGLSMGMSGDFEVAVEEGATWVRLGTVLFGNRAIEGAA